MDRGVAALASALAWSSASAQGELADVVVSVSRSEQRSFDAPASIQSVDQEQIRTGGPQINASESLMRIPGIAAQSRQNYAQDLQVSIRGFGARSTFGIRGIRILVDGIPATMPDGQGQLATVSLPSTQRIEVLRGPLALLYGNAAGGVIQAFSRDGALPPTLGADAYVGSYDTQRYGLTASSIIGGVSAMADYSWMTTGGYREHSAARRQHLNAKFGFELDTGTRITLVANLFDQPESLDPGGLTRAQFEANPRQASPAAVAQNARKEVAQSQLGVVAEHRFDANRTLSGRIYGGQRDLSNALSVPLVAQLPPTSSGGIVDLDRGFGGLGLQYAQRIALGATQLVFTVGAESDRMSEHRRGYINNAGQQGALKRDEDNTVQSNGVFGQLSWILGDSWTMIAGLRYSDVRFRTSDNFIVPGNPDDSGNRDYSATNPVAGVTWHALDTLNVYANLGQGFETPTFTELAYRPGGSGLNYALQSSTSRHAEVGAKWIVTPTQRLDVAIFRIETDDEIVVDTNVGGRTTFRNAGRTQRTGLELAWTGRLTSALTAQFAYTRLQATFVDGFGSGASTVAPGNRLPGVPDRRTYFDLLWQPNGDRGPFAGLEIVDSGRMYVNDANSDAAASWTVANLRAGLRQRIGPWRFSQWLRIDNVGDLGYAGSVIVNEAQQRYFEGAPGRNWMVGLTAARTF
jgi:iron complex outermembrane receptor protein